MWQSSIISRQMLSLKLELVIPSLKNALLWAVQAETEMLSRKVTCKVDYCTIKLMPFITVTYILKKEIHLY